MRMARRSRSGGRKIAHEVETPSRRATTIASEGRFVLESSPANSRLFIYLLGRYLHRIEQRRRSVYLGDLDLVRVAEVIAIAGVEPGMRDADFRQRHRSFDSVIGVEGQRGVNATSISNTLEMPRETVRRKLKILLKAGFIIAKSRTLYVLNPGGLQEPDRQAAFAWGIQQTVLLMNELVEQGVVRWLPAKAIKSQRSMTS